MQVSLEEKTKQYWDISKVFYAGVGVSMTMSEAINKCGDIADWLGPSRLLRTKVLNLNSRLIQGRGKRRKTSKVINNVVVIKQATI